MRIMRALLLGANSKRQPTIQISTELKGLIDIEASLQGGTVGFVNGWRACGNIAETKPSDVHQIYCPYCFTSSGETAHKNPRSSKLRATLDEPT
jgi:hypothetical protein